MGDENDGSVPRQIAQHSPQAKGGFVIEAVCRFIEQQYRWIAQQGAGNGDTLALAGRQLAAGLADGRAVAIGEVDDELMDAGERRRADDFLVAGIGQPVRDVVADRAGEKNALLRDIAAPSGDLGAGELGDVGAVQRWPNLTGARPISNLSVSSGRANPLAGELRWLRRGAVAEWLRSGLQSRVHRFESGPRL